MHTQRSDQHSTPMRPLDSLAWLYSTPQAELDTLAALWQHYQAGVLTLNEAVSTMEGKHLWQLLASQLVR